MRRKAFLFTFLVLSLLLAACVRSGGTEGENSYTIYYPAAELRDVPGEDAIVARTVQLPDADTLTQEELAQRLLERLLADPPDAGVRAPMPGGTTLLSLSVLGNWARVDFSRQYARLAGIDLTLADYCVTLTLTQLDGVNAVSITSGGRELPYRETQTLTAADPLLSMREDALRPITVSLYFLDPTSGALRAEKRALALYEGQTRVNALLEALAQGPESDALAALLPEEFTVLSAVLELPAMTLVSRLQKRFSPGFFLRFAAGAEVVKFLIFYLARSMPFIYLGQCMQFFQFAVYAPATVYYVAAALPERDQLKGQSLIYVAGSGLGGALGNLLGGRLLDRSGIQAALLLGTVSAAASLLTFCLSTREDSR